MMPLMSGWQVLDQMKAIPELAAVSVIVISTGAKIDISPPVKSYLEKPLCFEKVLNLITA